MSSSWGPSSLTSPDCMTAIMSALRIVDRRCAITIVVRPIDARSRASCTTRSDSVSNALVASSRRRILGDFRIALAIAILCFCPPDIWTPRSPTCCLLERNYAEAAARKAAPQGSWEMKLCALAALAAATTSSAVASSFPNRMFSLMLVANSAGSWLTSPICARSHFSRSRRMSTPSTVTSPANGS
uniref:Uncharacterized protein n=1 Tax=Oryza nivara TaxID=4536 RepID=A0A0E0G344_ORYNI